MINVQGDQILTMEGWLADNGAKPAGPDVRCDVPSDSHSDSHEGHDHGSGDEGSKAQDRKLAAAPKATDAPRLRRRLAKGTGTSEDPCISTNCEGDGPRGPRPLRSGSASWPFLDARRGSGFSAVPRRAPRTRRRNISLKTEPPRNPDARAGNVCTFTAIVDPHAGPTGYFKFAECGDVAMPVIGMQQGITYNFDQSDASNWSPRGAGLARAPRARASA